MSPEQLWHYEHAYLRPMHPEASDAEIGRMVDQLKRDAQQRIEDRKVPATVRVAVDAMTHDMAKITIGDLAWVMTRPDAQRVAEMITGTAKRGTSGWTTVEMHPWLPAE